MTFDNALMFLREILNPLRKLLSEISDAVEAVAETTNAEKIDAKKRASRYQRIRTGKWRIRSLILDRRFQVYHCRNACQEYGEWR